jgi:ribosomal peptide maturation radical SAM protein 1
MLKKEEKISSNNISLEDVLEPANVLLVASPFTSFTIPSLGLHLLQASCQGAGIKAKVLYSNLLYSNLIGMKLHKAISEDIYLLLKERLFAVAAFGIDSVTIGRMMHKFSDPKWLPDHFWKVKQHFSDPQVTEPVANIKEWLCSVDLKYLESLTNSWLHALAREIAAIGFRIVGCSTTMGGLLPVVALLNHVKKADPGVITIIGGALCEAEMAEGILSLNTGIDYIFSGEGEVTLPALVKQIMEGHLPGEKIIYGQEITDLDTIPLPDYREYVVQREKYHPTRAAEKKAFKLPFETSRGCWYGKCTFCGIKGKKGLFRSKSADRVIQGLKALVERHGMNVVIMADLLMPSQYFDTLLPRLPNEIDSIRIHYPMKVNLTLDQVISLRNAGIIKLQPGIESLSPSLLKRMRKPQTVRDNIALLRYSRSAGINLVWFLLFGFPGDQINEYEEMLHLLPLIRHLQPPIDTYPLILCRYNRYQTSPGEFGISNLQPAGVFKDTFPSHADLDKIAYCFTADFPSQSLKNPAIIIALRREVQAWRRAWAPYETIPLDILLPTLHVSRKTSDRYVLEDTRGLPGRPKQIEIDREQAGLLLLARPLGAAPDDDVRWAVDAGLGVVMGSWFIPLATAEPELLQEFEYDSKHLRFSDEK